MSVFIAMVNAKGGTGKTTSSIMLATALTRLGKSVIVLDADPQGSATGWAENSAEAGAPFEFRVELANVRTLGRKRSADVVIVDCPPGDTDLVSTAIRCADLVIIPTCHSDADQERLWATASVCLGNNVPFLVLITRAMASTRTYQALREALDEEGVESFPVAIPQREALKTWGPIGRELYGYGEAAEELIKRGIIQ